METWFTTKNGISKYIYGNMVSYVNDCLSNRTLQVRINNTCSDIYIVQNGTPQGSCISPVAVFPPQL
jgi:hypothetical protein